MYYLNQNASDPSRKLVRAVKRGKEKKKTEKLEDFISYR